MIEVHWILLTTLTIFAMAGYAILVVEFVTSRINVAYNKGVEDLQRSIDSNLDELEDGQGGDGDLDDFLDNFGRGKE